jgi:hypothetical protein
VEPQRNARVALILSVYATSWAGLAMSLGAGGRFAPVALVASLLVAALALWRVRRLGPGLPMPRAVIAINVATGAVIALVVAALAANGRAGLIGPAVALVMAVHFAPLAWTQRRISPAVLGLAMGVIGLFALERGGAQANGLAAGLSAVAFDLAALHQLWLARAGYAPKQAAQ